MFNRQLLRQIYLANMSAIAVSLSLSVWLLTFFLITIVVIWAADGGLKAASEIYQRNKYIILFSGIFMVYCIWMVNTSNIKYGFRELEQKLPLVILPFVIGLSKPLNARELKTIFSFFVTGVVLSSVIGVVHFSFDQNISETGNIRNLSLFIPYARLAELTNMSIVVSVFYFISDSNAKSRYLWLGAALWLTCFLFILLSLTGILLFVTLVFISVIILIKKSENTLLKVGFVSLVILGLVLTGAYISHSISEFNNKCTSYTYPLKERTPGGKKYQHFPERNDIENGNPVWIYICEPELRKEWNIRSKINYDSCDQRKQKINYTLIRYLASKGLTKDSTGIAQLSDNDIRYIENGLTNKLFTEGNHLRSKVYEIIWQIDYYRNGGNPSGHSVTQRIEFLKTGINCFKANLFFGTGTGDFIDEIKSQYEKDLSRLDLQYRFLPHNQYLTMLVSFGIVGTLLIFFSLLIPVFVLKARRNYIFNIFLLIILISMMGEDTLETHTGVTFFAYFYSVFIFGKQENNLKL